MATIVEFMGEDYPVYNDKTEMLKHLSQGYYEWAYTHDGHRKTGIELPGIDDLIYKVVRLKENDLVLSIQILSNRIEVKVIQAFSGDREVVFEMTSTIGTIGDELLSSSISILDFKENLMTATDLYLKYSQNIDDEKEDLPESIDLTSIENSLKRLSNRN